MMLVQLGLVFVVVWLLVLRWERRRMIQLAKKFGSPNLWQLPVIGHSYVFIGSDEGKFKYIRFFLDCRIHCMLLLKPFYYLNILDDDDTNNNLDKQFLIA